MTHVRCVHGIYPHCERCDKIAAAHHQDEQLLELVQRQSVTLADLYRKGRAQGLLRGVSNY